jgi:hypothetical protein
LKSAFREVISIKAHCGSVGCQWWSTALPATARCLDGIDITRAREDIAKTERVVDTRVRRLLLAEDPVRVLETTQALPKLQDASRGQGHPKDDMNTLGVPTSVGPDPGAEAEIVNENGIRHDGVQDHAQVHMIAINVEERRKRRKKRRRKR